MTGPRLFGGPLPGLSPRQANSLRTSVIVSAVAGITLGVITLAWPSVTLLLVAVFFGIWLVIGGLGRIYAGISGSFVSAGSRWLSVVLGILILVGGVVCLFRPGNSLVILAVLIGVSWILDGFTALVHGFAHATIGPRWLAIVGGVIAVVAGIVVLFLPGLALTTFALWGGILLIVVSIDRLCSLPPKMAA